MKDPNTQFVSGELYGTRHPRNQIPNNDDFAFRVRSVNESDNSLEVQFVLQNGNKLLNTDSTDVLPYDKYKEALTNPKAPFTYLE